MRTLLLADDSVTIQRVIALTFANEDFRVISVSDGQQAIDQIAAQRPDIILADTTLPNGTGYDVSQYVRNQLGLEDLPVLLLAGAFESVDEERLRACGANGTIDKPFEPTIVISRVKALLGLGDTKPAPAAGRLVTSADTPAANRPSRPLGATPKPPIRAAAPSAIKPPLAKPVLDVSKASKEPVKAEELSLDSLDSALDTLDARLSSRPGDDSTAPRNPDPPARRSGPADPRSPGRLPSPQAANSDAVFEVDDDWFAAADSSRAANLAEQRKLAAEMGVHDVDLPEPQPGLHAAPAKDLDFDFGLDDVRPKVATINVHEEMASLVPPSAPEHSLVETAAEALMQSSAHPPPPEAAPEPVADPPATVPAAEPVVPASQPAPVEAAVEPSVYAPVVVQAPPPEITSAMLDQIAERVAERLNTSLFADHLRGVIATTVRDTVRSVVSETSEKLVRDEIARVRAQAEHDTQ
jgi:CheY-like chemotaxis protein